MGGLEMTDRHGRLCCAGRLRNFVASVKLYEVSMPDPKAFIYQYESDPESENEPDLEGKTDIPRAGDLIYRRQKIWKVTGVYPEHGSGIVSYRVLLADVSKPDLVN